MEDFRNLSTEQLRVFTTRVEVSDVDLQTAEKLSRQIGWDQKHIMFTDADKQKVSLSLITGVEESAKLWEFLQGEIPDPAEV